MPPARVRARCPRRRSRAAAGPARCRAPRGSRPTRRTATRRTRSARSPARARRCRPRPPRAAAAGRSSPWPWASQVPAQLLLALDRLEQGLEVALAEAAGAVALDDLEEHRRTVADRLREDLQHVALVVAVDEDAEAPQVLELLLDLADPLRHVLVVRVRHVEELDPALAHLCERAHRVARLACAG